MRDRDEVGGAAAVRIVEERELAGGIRCTDVEEDAAAGCPAAAASASVVLGLEDLAGQLVDRWVPIGAELAAE